MFPVTELRFLGLDMAILSNTLVFISGVLISFLLYLFLLRDSPLRIIHKVLLFGLSAIGAWLGARLFHVLLERPELLLQHPERIFTRWDGMTFYGSLFIGLALLTAICHKIKTFAPSRSQILDSAAIIAAFLYFWMRLGCFLNGCCWGKICSLPWAVQYFHPDSAMKGFGLPVHPVQLYDSFLGLILFCALIILYLGKKHRGTLMKIFLFSYALGRFATEFYRGDSYRGLDPWLGISTSQWISLLLLGVLAAQSLFPYILRQLKSPRLKPALNPLRLFSVTFIFLIWSTGCLPNPPSKGEAENRGPIFGSSVELFHVKGTRKSLPARNLIFVATDPDVQLSELDDETLMEKIQLQYRLKNKKHIPERIEELAWWMYFKRFKGLYHKVLRIPYDDFNFYTLADAIGYLERLKQPYDIVLLAHGIDNNIFASSPSPSCPNITYRNIPKLPRAAYDSYPSCNMGQGLLRNFLPSDLLPEGDEPTLKNLNLVMLQSCSGWSLRWEFMDLGAKAVIAHENLTKNFFYFEFFLKHLKTNNNPLGAWRNTNRRQLRELKASKLHRKAILEGIQRTTPTHGGYEVELYESVEEFLDDNEMPSLFIRMPGQPQPKEYFWPEE